MYKICLENIHLPILSHAVSPVAGTIPSLVYTSRSICACAYVFIPFLFIFPEWQHIQHINLLFVLSYLPVYLGNISVLYME